MVEYKKQHYVPQFYLRHFSNNDKIVYVYNINNKKTFPMNVKNICQKDYFYCDDSELEQSLGKIETKQARIIAELIRKSNFSSMSTEDKFYLHVFILMQYTRTKASKNVSESFIDTFFDASIKSPLKESNYLADKGIKPKSINSLKMGMDRPHLMGMSLAMLGADLIRDLKMVLILNQTDRDFITSDAPLCLYNYIKPKNYGMLGFQSPGLLIFCPLNEKILLLLFDPELYHSNSSEKSIIHVEKTSDVDAINKLQIHNCLESLIYSKEEDGAYLSQLHVEIGNNLKKSEIKSIVESKRHIGNGTHSKIIEIHHTSMDYTLKLSFLKLNHIVNKKIKGTIRKSKHSGELISLCRNIKICEIVRKRIENEKKRRTE